MVMISLKEKKKKLDKLADEILKEEEQVAYAVSKSLVGRCYKYDNGYNNTDRWWLYVKVLSADGSWLRVEKIQRDNYNMITYHPYNLIHLLNGAMIGKYIEITPKVYERAKNRIGRYIVNTVDWTHEVPEKKLSKKDVKLVRKILLTQSCMKKEKTHGSRNTNNKR